MDLFLISSSSVYEKGYLDHCYSDLIGFINGSKEILFIPFALNNHDEYEEIVAGRFRDQNIKVNSVHRYKDYIGAINDSTVIFIGGGNTFRLLDNLIQKKLMEPIRNLVLEGTKFIGSSAGANVAGIDIKTTNDMPIVFPLNLDGLKLVPFNINPHYFSKPAKLPSTQESRDQRIDEFHEENNQQVLAMEEGVYICGFKLLVQQVC